MIRIADIGNCTTKDNFMNIFESKVSCVPDMLNSKNKINLNGEDYFLKGSFDTEYRKAYKDNYMNLLYAILCMSTEEINNYINLVVALPLSQYKNDKEYLTNRILSSNLQGVYKGYERNFFINDIEVYLEGLAAVESNYEGVIVDIGGRTTDASLVYFQNGKRKITNPYSIPVGTIKLYSDFIKLINSKYSLTLDINDVQRILSRGLRVDNKLVSVAEEIVVFKEYLNNLISDLNVQYSLRTNDITFTGGGSLLLKGSILKRLPDAEVLDNAVFSNALGMYEHAKEIWI